MSVDGALERVPVSIVTGFLGSGKTTLISSLLKQPDMAGTAVIVNEFGAVGIDDAIIAEVADGRDVRLLANGCLCCTAGDDLTATLLELTVGRAGGEKPRRILIETTGLADPVPLLHRLMGDPRLRPSIRLDAIVATVDAVNGNANLDSQPVASRRIRGLRSSLDHQIRPGGGGGGRSACRPASRHQSRRRRPDRHQRRSRCEPIVWRIPV